MEIYTTHIAKGKVLLSAFFFFVLGLIGTAFLPNTGAIIPGHSNWGLWLFILICLGLGLLSLSRLRDRRELIRVSPEGLRYSPWSNATVPWSEIADLIWIDVPGNQSVQFEIPNAQRYGPITGKGLTGHVTASGKLMILLGGMTGNLKNLLAAINQYWPVEANIQTATPSD